MEDRPWIDAPAFEDVAWCEVAAPKALEPVGPLLRWKPAFGELGNLEFRCTLVLAPDAAPTTEP